MLVDLQATVAQLPHKTCSHEANVVAGVLRHKANRKRGEVKLGELLPAVLAKLNAKSAASPKPKTDVTENENNENGGRS